MRGWELALGVCWCATAAAAPLKVTVSALPQGAQPVGTSITFTANATGASSKTLYMFEYRKSGTTAWQKIEALWYAKTLRWTLLQEGSYQLLAYAYDPSTKASGQAIANVQFTSRASGGQPVVSPTGHPLVFLYSAAPCSGSVTATYAPLGSSTPQTTPSYNCNGSATVNFYLAGLLANTTYTAQQQGGPVLTFTTGTPTIPVDTSYVILQPPDANTCEQQPILLGDKGGSNYASAVDLAGNLLWYYQYAPKSNPQGTYWVRPAPDQSGNQFFILGTVSSGSQLLTESDLAGNTVWSTSVPAVNRQLATNLQASWLSHDAVRLPNGHTLTLASVERLYQNVQGVNGTVDIVGDIILDLDSNMNVAWLWSSFDNLNINQTAILGEVCTTTQNCGGPLHLAATANDWTHASFLLYRPADGNIILGLKSQDLILKINYANGTGDGHIVWQLGQAGDFALGQNSVASTWPWFSHMHDMEPTITDNTYTLMDNGDTRVAAQGGDSRGQVWELDEVNLVATLQLNVDLGAYSKGSGSSAQLDNGNYYWQLVNPQQQTEFMELLPSTELDFEAQRGGPATRLFRMASMYSVQ
jgi:hypothetical protein